MPRLTNDAEMRRCIQTCSDCHRECLECATTHCLQEGGRHVEPDHFRLMLDCAQICQTSADFMLRASSLHLRTCEVCAETCEQCAQSCERIGDQRMQQCAEICRACASACRSMAGILA